MEVTRILTPIHTWWSISITRSTDTDHGIFATPLFTGPTGQRVRNRGQKILKNIFTISNSRFLINFYIQRFSTNICKWIERPTVWNRRSWWFDEGNRLYGTLHHNDTISSTCELTLKFCAKNSLRFNVSSSQWLYIHICWFL